jgi:osmotically-inducible protein OsmY
LDAPRCDSAACADDARIARQMDAWIEHRGDIFESDVAVQVRAGVVYLHGLVDTDLQREEMVAAARAIPGVRSVVESLALHSDPGF